MTKLFDVHSTDETADSVAAFFPNDKLWRAKYTKETVLRQLMEGFGATVKNVEDLIELFADEFHLETTTIFIDEWEGAVGIPDGCFSNLVDIETRRLQVLVKFRARGVQSKPNFIALAAILGFDITISPGSNFLNPFPPFIVPFIPSAGASTELEEKNTWRISGVGLEAGLPPYIVPFTPGSRADSLICFFNRIKPAYTNLIFENSEMAATPKLFQNNVPQVDADDLNRFKLEYNNLIQTTGQTLNVADNKQTSRGVQRTSLQAEYYIDSSVGPDVYVLNSVVNNGDQLISVGQYIKGMRIRFRPNFNNSGGPVTIDVDDFGERSLITSDGFNPTLDTLTTEADVTATFFDSLGAFVTVDPARVITDQAIERENLIWNGHFVGVTYKSSQAGLIGNIAPSLGYLTADCWLLDPGTSVLDTVDYSLILAALTEPLIGDADRAIQIISNAGGGTNSFFLRNYMLMSPLSRSSGTNRVIAFFPTRQTAGTAAPVVKPKIVLNFGIGGSATIVLTPFAMSDVVTGFQNGVSELPLTTTFQRFTAFFDIPNTQASVYGISPYTYLEIEMDGVTGSLFTVQFTDAKVERGTLAGPNPSQSRLSKTLANSTTIFFQKSYQASTTPGDIDQPGNVAEYSGITFDGPQSSTNFYDPMYFSGTDPSQLPIVAIYSPITGAEGNISVVEPVDTIDVPAIVQFKSHYGFTINPTPFDVIQGRRISYQWFAHQYPLPFILP